jgi:hypothetical protein
MVKRKTRHPSNTTMQKDRYNFPATELKPVSALAQLWSRYGSDNTLQGDTAGIVGIINLYLYVTKRYLPVSKIWHRMLDPQLEVHYVPY